MPRLPKFDIEGHVHFVTTNVMHRRPLFISQVLAQIVVDNLHWYSQHLNYGLVGYVVMPDHMHALIQPHELTPISKIMQSVKKRAAREVINYLSSGIDLQIMQFPPELTQIRLDRVRCLDQDFPRLEDFHVKRPKMGSHLYQIWQEGFYDFNVFNEAKLYEKLNYIHCNPVAWGLAETPDQYPFSSYQRWSDE